MILGSEVIPTPTAATIDNPAVIAAAQINAQLAETQARLTAVAALFPSLANDDRPAHHGDHRLRPERRRPDPAGPERLGDLHSV